MWAYTFLPFGLLDGTELIEDLLVLLLVAACFEVVDVVIVVGEGLVVVVDGLPPLFPVPVVTCHFVSDFLIRIIKPIVTAYELSSRITCRYGVAAFASRGVAITKHSS